MTSTLENLKIAFAGECQAIMKYTLFAKKADDEGFKTVAKLFRAAAQAETVHATYHFKNMDALKSTAENLKAAFNGETEEYTQMYPPMVKKAEEEGHKAKIALGFAMAAEEVHANLYAKAIECLKEGKDLDEMEIWYCPVCGYIEYGKTLPEKCPICKAPAKMFVKM